MRKIYCLGAATLVVSLLGSFLGYFMRLDLPDVHALEDLRPAQMTRVLSGNGSEIAAFASEKRILLGYEEIPASFREALIASEDSEFLRHPGVDLKGVVRAVLSDLRQRRRAEGASTITMQLAGNLFLDRSHKTVLRKLQEMALALEIEREYSKEEILRMYANQVHMGHGLYGLGAAARYYFGKPAGELTTGESAVLVGLLPRPASYSPLENLERATRQRNRVLRRMTDEGYLEAEEAERLASRRIVVADERPADGDSSYFVEETRRWLQMTYGSTELYRGGLEARTTMDPELQRIAENAVDVGLRRLDKRAGWRPEAVRRVPAGEDPRSWSPPGGSDPVAEGRVADAIVIEVERERATVRLGDRIGALGGKQIAWTGATRPDRLLEVGDIVRVRVVELDPQGGVRLLLEQEPEAQAALVALEPSTGRILAMVGGLDFSRSEFNRATQARRQTGSAFKPFVFAAALDRGLTLADTLLDEPTVFLGRAGQRPYQPENFNRRYHETITLRTALEKSANIATVKLLDRIGYEPVIDIARRLGIESDLRPYPSLALGAFEATLLELTGAYATFANQGLYVTPHWVSEVIDAHGRTIHRARPEVRDALSPQVAYLMNRALSGVVTDGTGRAASALGRTLAGKTGTTDDNTDAWFIGYSRNLAVGVWVGFDERRSLGSGETGSRAALPIWIEFMGRATEGRADEEFPVPSGISFMTIDRQTGRRVGGQAGCEDRITEAFIEASESLEPCTDALHRLMKLPYPFQRYRLDADGALRIPGDELARLLDAEPAGSWILRDRQLEFHLPDEVLTIELELLADRIVVDAGETAGSASWLGTDGQAATVVRLREGR